MSIAKQLLEIFGGNPYFGIGKINNESGNVWYDPVNKPLTAAVLESHLKGTVILSSYPLDQNDLTVKWIGWDVDAAGDIEAARNLTKSLIEQLGDLPYVVEYSGGKGYHVFLFISEPISAVQGKAISEYIRDKAGVPKSETGKAKGHVEAYPKQDKLGKSTEKRKAIGNCIKIPLGLHPKSHKWSKFVDPYNGFEDGQAMNPEELLEYRVEPKEVFALKEDIKDRTEIIVQLIAEQWTEGKRHQLALFLSGYMASIGISMDLAKSLTERIAKAANDPEPDDRIKTVEDTYKKVAHGTAVAGYSRLGELLPGASMALITRLVPELAEPSIVRQVEKIRLGKGDAWIKVKTVIKLVWSDLSDRGKFLVQPEEGRAYWFNNETHLITRVGSELWTTLMYQHYHINIVESFYRQVYEGIMRMALSEGKPVEIRRRSVWDGDRLFVNLGGEEVYILNGNEIMIEYNGDCGYIFHTNDPNTVVPIPDFDNMKDCWKFLVDDLNFMESERAPISPDKQAELLKAWILSSFFKELLPTRPILALLGEAGSGKTTAARRILRIVEGLSEDVTQALSDKPDSWRASVAAHHLVVLDNLERSGARWMVDSLNLIATGAHIELRRLYKDNEVYKIKPDCFVILTAVQMPFPDETLISRLLVLDLQRLTTFIPEHDFKRKITQNANGIWGDILAKLNDVVAVLRSKKSVKLISAMRLADFVIFCKQLEESGLLDGEKLEAGLKALGSSQMQALAKSEYNIVPILEEWMRIHPKDASQKHTVSEIMAALQPIASLRKHPWRWSTSQALWSHLNAMKDYLIQELGASFEKVYSSSKGKDENVISFPNLKEEVSDDE